MDFGYVFTRRLSRLQAMRFESSALREQVSRYVYDGVGPTSQELCDAIIERQQKDNLYGLSAVRFLSCGFD